MLSVGDRLGLVGDSWWLWFGLCGRRWDAGLFVAFDGDVGSCHQEILICHGIKIFIICSPSLSILCQLLLIITYIHQTKYRTLRIDGKFIISLIFPKIFVHPVWFLYPERISTKLLLAVELMFHNSLFKSFMEIGCIDPSFVDMWGEYSFGISCGDGLGEILMVEMDEIGIKFSVGN